MDIYRHVLGKRDFLIKEKEVSVTEFRRKPSAAWKYVGTPGHVVFFTRRGKRVCALMSIETHACLSGDYEAEMTEVEREAQAYREKKKANRRRKAQYENRGEQGCSISQETHTESSAESSGNRKYLQRAFLHYQSQAHYHAFWGQLQYRIFF